MWLTREAETRLTRPPVPCLTSESMNELPEVQRPPDEGEIRIYFDMVSESQFSADSEGGPGAPEDRCGRASEAAGSGGHWQLLRFH